MRRVTVRVLPAPATATMRTGPSTAVAAARCASSKPSRIASAEVAMHPLCHASLCTIRVLVWNCDSAKQVPIGGVGLGGHAEHRRIRSARREPSSPGRRILRHQPGRGTGCVRQTVRRVRHRHRSRTEAASGPRARRRHAEQGACAHGPGVRRGSGGGVRIR